MRSLQKLCPTVAGISLLAAAAIVFGDIPFIRRYGVDFSDAAFVTADGQAVDWPTGEHPLWAAFPAWVYAIPPAITALVALALWPAMRSCRLQSVAGESSRSQGNLNPAST